MRLKIEVNNFRKIFIEQFVNSKYISSHENKKALSSFYHKKILLIANEYHFVGVLHVFSIKNIFL